MTIEQVIDNLEIDLSGFNGKQGLEPILADSLLDSEEVAGPLKEDCRVVRHCLDHLLEQALLRPGPDQRLVTASLSDIKHLMGRCFRLGRRYEELRGVGRDDGA